MFFFLKTLVPAFLLLIMAFIAGSQKNPLFGMMGFVGFFTGAVMLVIRGWQLRKESRSE